MLFNSYSFMLFFPIVLLLYFVIPRKAREYWLLVSSLFFYMCWNAKYLILILISIIVTYSCGLLVENIEGKKRKAIMISGLVVNFAILFFFKYFNFAIDGLNSVLSKLSITTVNTTFDVILPVGISFYTFQAVGYMIDVYRGDIKAEKNFVRYALFVSFFPQLVAGPIERSKNILSQIETLPNRKLWDFDRIKSGAFLMAWGYFLKMVIADRISIIVDEVFDRYYAYGTLILIVGVIGFSIQIYCDFLSYSTIAIGSAQIMGFALMDNFDTPYFAMSIKEFWRRWHISLSTWFKDYLYIPLGGSRTTKIKRYRNIMITFLVSGLWHGANWTFVVWGGLHGLYQIIGDLLEPVRGKFRVVFGADINSFGYKLGRMLGTTILAAFAWIFFRAETMSVAVSYVKRMFTHFDPWSFFDQSIYKLGLSYQEIHILVIALLILFAFSLCQYRTHKKINEFICSQGPVFQVISMYVLVMFIILFGKYGPSEDLKAFLYFQF